MTRLYEQRKIDIGVVSQALNNTNVTGRYYSMKGFHKAIAILNVAAMVATKTAKIELLQATDEAGNGAKAITGAEATITANALASEVTLTLANVLNGDAVTINGLTFTAHTDTTTKSARQFAIDGDDTADAVELAACINDPTYGVPGVTATAALGVITLTPSDSVVYVSGVPGGVAITIADPAATITPATTKAQAFVEIQNYALDHSNGFTHIAVKITTTANTVVSAVLERGCARDAITQTVGASGVV